MKGIVFTEFLDMVENEFGYETVDHIIEASNLESNGVYTSIGTYEFAELLSLVVNLSKKTKVEIPVLIKAFGKYLFDTFLKGYPVFFERSKNGFEFLSSIDNYIHVEVRKLYSDAELPSFKSNMIGSNKMELIYFSSRRLYSLAEGLIEKTMEHYNHEYELETQLLNEDGGEVKFIITTR